MSPLPTPDGHSLKRRAHHVPVPNENRTCKGVAKDIHFIIPRIDGQQRDGLNAGWDRIEAQPREHGTAGAEGGVQVRRLTRDRDRRVVNGPEPPLEATKYPGA